MLLSYFQSNTCFKITDKIYLKSIKRTNSTCLLLYIYFLSLKVRRSSLNYSCFVSEIIYDWYFSWLLLHAWVGTVFLRYFTFTKLYSRLRVHWAWQKYCQLHCYGFSISWKINGNVHSGRFPFHTQHTSGPSFYILPRCSHPSLASVPVTCSWPSSMHLQPRLWSDHL